MTKPITADELAGRWVANGAVTHDYYAKGLHAGRILRFEPGGFVYMWLIGSDVPVRVDSFAAAKAAVEKAVRNA